MSSAVKGYAQELKLKARSTKVVSEECDSLLARILFNLQQSYHLPYNFGGKRLPIYSLLITSFFSLISFLSLDN